MKKKIKEQWITALRSGDYKQGKSVLNDNNEKFCCLGVLCDLAVKAGVGEWQDSENIDLNGLFRVTSPKQILGSSFVLPVKIARWAGFKVSKKRAKELKLEGGINLFVDTDGYRELQALSSLNDSEGYSFDMIADLIEKKKLTAA